MTARRDEKILPAGGGEKTFEAVVLVFDAVSLYEVVGCLVAPHCLKEVGRRDEDRELKLRLAGSIRDIHVVEPGSVHSDMQGCALRVTGRTM